MVSPVPVASSDPVVTCWLEVSIKALISLAAVALRCASVRTSAATTAKPRPCSPARAASTAAFSARILVWKAMPSMTEMISWTLAELAAMSCMVAIMRRMAWPPASAVCEAASAIALPCCALSVFCFTADVSCSMLAAVCSSDAACPRCDPRDLHCRSRAGTTRWKWRRRRSGCGTRSRSVARAWSPARRSGCSRRRRWDAGSASGCHWRSRAISGLAAARRRWRSTLRVISHAASPPRASASAVAPRVAVCSVAEARSASSAALVAQARFQRGQRGQL